MTNILSVTCGTKQSRKEVFTVVYGVLSSEQCSSGWSAERKRVVVVEDDAIVSQGVDVWRRNLIRPVETYVIPTL